MNKQETIQLLTLIQSFYENMIPKNQDAQKMYIELWHDSLCEISFIDAQMALKEHLKESVYVPKIADIYQRVMSKRMPAFPDPVAEWNTVLIACQRFGYTRANEAMESFQPYTKKVVEAFGGFRKICMAECDQEMADRKHFVDMYNRLIEREIKSFKQGGAGILQLDAEQKKEPSLIDTKINSLVQRMK